METTYIVTIEASLLPHRIRHIRKRSNAFHLLLLFRFDAHRLTFPCQCPEGYTADTLSISGEPVRILPQESTDPPPLPPDAHRPPRAAFRGEWAVHGRPPSDISVREKLDVTIVVSAAAVRGAIGHQHLLRARLLCKFYAPDNPRYAAKGKSVAGPHSESRLGRLTRKTDLED